MSILTDVTITPPTDSGQDEPEPQFDPKRFRYLHPCEYTDELIEKKFESWKRNFSVKDELMLFQLRELVTAVVRLELAGKYERAMLKRMRLRAEFTWDLDRTSEALAIAAKLHRNPSRWREALLRTAQGCRWMLGEWRSLQRALEVQGTWTARQYSHAQDLLGVHPIHRNGSEGTEVVDRETFQQICADQIENLESLLENQLTDLDEFARQQAIEGFSPYPDSEVWAMRRYLADCQRRFLRLWNLMRPYYLALPEPATPRSEPSAKRTQAAPSPTKAAEADYGRIFAAATELCSKPSPPRNARSTPAEPSVKTHPEAPQAHGNRRQRRRAAALARRSR